MELTALNRRSVSCIVIGLVLMVLLYRYSYIIIPKERTSNRSTHECGQHNTRTGGASVAAGYPYENIMKMKPIKYLPNFKNPCWIGTADNGPIHDNKMHCLPYFYIIGVRKCGTTDLFYRILCHPDVVYPGFKEAQWFSLRRFHRGPKNNHLPKHLLKQGSPLPDSSLLEFYIRMFDDAAKQMHDNSITVNKTKSILITGEGTPANLHKLGLWDLLPENKGLCEPRYTNLHYIKHLIPAVKIIILFRNPVNRLYSDFLVKNWDKKATGFHKYVVSTISMYRECFDRFSFRRCMFNNTLRFKTKGIFAFKAGFYAFHMKEIRNVFSNNQVLPILFQDYISDMQKTLTTVYRFLGLSDVSQSLFDRILQRKTENSGQSKRREAGPMLNETKSLLETFYRPYNEEMAKLMNDDRYLFND